jgi:hypothetical protein
LPKEFSSFSSAIRTCDDSLSIEKASVLLQTEEQSMKESSEQNTALAMFASGNNKPMNNFGRGQGNFGGANRGRGRNNNQRG